MNKFLTPIIGMISVALTLGVWLLTSLVEAQADLLQVTWNVLRLFISCFVGFGIGFNALKLVDGKVD